MAARDHPYLGESANAESEPFVDTVRAQFERMRNDLNAALQGSVSQVQEAFLQATLKSASRVGDLERERDLAVVRFRDVERERDLYAGRLRELEAQVKAHALAFEEMERKFADEIRARDLRIEEYSAKQDHWEAKIQALVEIKNKVDSLLG